MPPPAILNSTNEAWDLIEEELKVNLQYEPIVFKAHQEYIDNDNKMRARILNISTFLHVGKIASWAAKFLSWSPLYEKAVTALVGGVLSTEVTDGDWYKTSMRAGDIIVIIDGKVGVFRNGILVRDLTSRNFWASFERSSKKSSTLKFIKDEASAVKNNGGENGNGNFQSVDNGSANDSSGPEVKCITAYTGSNGNNIPQPVCWLE